ncbi:MAG: amino acid ABC transporter substrate-binding protein [Alphaproteobacteria bacterium]|nr:amino acid ABC transporter substrate-binding protein [Alphaproteobacteria bacterium]
MSILRNLFVATLALCAAAPPLPAAEPLVIGLPLSQTGNLADSAEHVRKGLTLWLEQVNVAGGILGRPVELKTYDDKSDPGTAVRLTERLITSDKVDLLISPFGSSATIAASAVNEKHRRVAMNVSGASQQIHQRGFRYIVQVVAPSNEYVAGIFPVAARAGHKTIAYIARDYTGARDVEAAVRALAAQHGMTIVMLEYFPAGTTDFSSHITRARDLKPDVWISIGYPNEAIEMIRQMRAGNYAPKMFVSNGVSQEDFITATGRDGDYAFGISLYEPGQKTKGNEAFVRDFRARWGYEPGYYAAMGWAAAAVLREAVEKAGTIDQEKIRGSLLELRTETPFGPFAVDATGAQVAKKAMIIQVRNGRREIVWPFELQTMAPVLPMPTWAER